jgi:hypothetical protein
MEKLVYIIWKEPAVPVAQFKEALLTTVATRLIERGTHRLSVNLADEFVAHATTARLTKFDPPPAGAISFWLDLADDRGPYEDALRAATSRAEGYLVVESVPLVNTTHIAPIGERTPGINIVTCIEKPDRLTYDAWLELWHVEHRKVALETQSTFAYVRNVVVRALTPGAPPWAGIVEESFPSEAVTDPMVWYQAGGSRDTLRHNMKRMMDSVQAFLDIDRVESHPMSEYRMQA